MLGIKESKEWFIIVLNQVKFLGEPLSKKKTTNKPRQTKS